MRRTYFNIPNCARGVNTGRADDAGIRLIPVEGGQGSTEICSFVLQRSVEDK